MSLEVSIAGEGTDKYGSRIPLERTTTTMRMAGDEHAVGIDLVGDDNEEV